MGFESKKIKEIYAGKVAETYDIHVAHFFKRVKKSTFSDSSMKNGDKVLVFCCGTGLDFPHILRKIGKEGEITGVDFSSEMLNKAKDKIRKNKWENIELIEADITKFKDKLDKKFDIGVCTLGISIIPDYKSAYYNLISYVKNEGEIIIGDMQLATGWQAHLNPLTISFSKKYGGTYEGHKNSLELCSMMKKELTDVRKKEFLFNSYYYCIGKTR
ncbi:MAG: methyltransferase domain-containing protein [Candidatus Electryonea clarkiae]|nr:methyltransferase domain-containing protein [Candidatus Electryonea clarkiae]MDP8286001.1 methyltransferase domain-containing protein [Candidatus Electryonea clarkiae]